MSILRIYLFAGLLVHKLIWEILKRRDRSALARQKTANTQLLRLIKLAKILVLGFFVVQTLFLNLFPIVDHSTPLIVLGIAIYTLGLVMAIIGRFQLGKNWVDLEDYQTLPGQSVVTEGIYRYIRHPIYAGDFLLILGLELALNSWVVLGVPILGAVVLKQALAEEAMLSKKFPDYEAYRANTKRFIPFLY